MYKCDYGKRNDVDRSVAKEILRARLVDGEQAKSIAKRLGMTADKVSKISRGERNLSWSVRNELIRELRAEGHNIEVG